MKDLSPTLKIVTVWGLVGLAVFLAVQFWQAHEARTRFTATADGVIEIRRGPDGHYHWPGRVNGVEVDFLVDTGASSTALPLALAERAGLRGEGRITSSTAGGMVRGTLARADIDLDGGVRAERLRVAILPALAAPLLGMDVLSQLHFAQSDGVLRLTPRPAGQ
ncbi:MAG TPA: retropepsin-like aspartic protease [Burkholderiaceae bacterium]|nr:retropepsin-like aspartic protease [Burkholderiaceae bacterium]